MATPSSPAAGPSNPQASPQPSTAGCDRPPTESHESATHAWRQVAILLAQIREFAAHYLQTRIDAVKLSIRRLILCAALGIVALVALSAVLVMMIVYLFEGIAGGFGELFHGRLWLGDLVTTGIFLLVMTATTSWALGAIRRAGRRQTVQKYETRQSQQRVNFGTDVHQRAGGG